MLRNASAAVLCPVVCGRLGAQTSAGTAHRDTAVVWGNARPIAAQTALDSSFAWQPSCVRVCSTGESGNAATLIFRQLRAELDMNDDRRDVTKTLSVALPAQVTSRSASVTIHHTLRFAVLKDAGTSAVVVVNGQARTWRFLKGSTAKENATRVEVVVPAAARDSEHYVTYVVSVHRDGGKGMVKLAIDTDDIRIDAR